MWASHDLEQKVVRALDCVGKGAVAISEAGSALYTISNAMQKEGLAGLLQSELQKPVPAAQVCGRAVVKKPASLPAPSAVPLEPVCTEEKRAILHLLLARAMKAQDIARVQQFSRELDDLDTSDSQHSVAASMSTGLRSMEFAQAPAHERVTSAYASMAPVASVEPGHLVPGFNVYVPCSPPSLSHMAAESVPRERSMDNFNNQQHAQACRIYPHNSRINFSTCEMTDTQASFHESINWVVGDRVVDTSESGGVFVCDHLTGPPRRGSYPIVFPASEALAVQKSLPENHISEVPAPEERVTSHLEHVRERCMDSHVYTSSIDSDEPLLMVHETQPSAPDAVLQLTRHDECSHLPSHEQTNANTSVEPPPDDDRCTDTNDEQIGLSALQDVYEVETVLDMRIATDGKREFLIKWRGWGPAWNNWEPEEHILDRRMLRKFNRRRQPSTSAEPSVDCNDVIIRSKRRCARHATEKARKAARADLAAVDESVQEG